MTNENVVKKQSGIHIGKDVHGSVVVTGDNNIITITKIRSERMEPESAKQTPIGSNPYLGLGTFQESDADRFFGRKALTQELWEKFRDLIRPQTDDKTIRLLPVLGPSGSGKSSVVRAGLIPELARRNPRPDKQKMQVAVMTPEVHPLESLAEVLAQIKIPDDNDPKRMDWAETFEAKLKKPDDEGEWDGLRRCVKQLPEIETASLVILADQFEEVYSLCKKEDERNAFIGNLLHAAADPSGHVSVILTLRSDFLGDTQSHERLNRTIARNEKIIPAMSTEEMRRAIAQPAADKGHPLDDAVVSTLIEQTRGRSKGALPLLQFALTRIWEGMAAGQTPAKTLDKIGGVGGALAEEAQQLFDDLDDDEKVIAKRAFLSMVTLGEGAEDTRRRVDLKHIVSKNADMERVKKVLERFSGRDARLITLSGQRSAGGLNMAEVTHEALLGHWTTFKKWLKAGRDDLRLLQRMENAADHWSANKKSSGLLWRTPDLEQVRELYKTQNQAFGSTRELFYKKSERAHQRGRFIGFGFVGLLCIFLVAALYYAEMSKQKELEANYNMAGMLQEKASFALDAAIKGDNYRENIQKAWLYTLEALNQDIPANRKLGLSLERLGRRDLAMQLLANACAKPDARLQTFVSGGPLVHQWKSALKPAYEKDGNKSAAFKAVYQCSFALFPFAMQEGVLIDIDKKSTQSDPRFNQYPRPAGMDPLQWMIASAENDPKAIEQATIDAKTPKLLPFDDSNLNATFAYIPAGTFLMGSPPDEAGRYSDEPLHIEPTHNQILSK
ncbi:hypothetical protein QUF90_02025 [Desulfococcaceae bacterium HSG9]|nr:hypothetical protein [Desulfococcaceae bacterium HSG9]